VASAYDPKRQQMSAAIAVTCWSAVWKVGPISLLELGLTDFTALDTLVEGLVGSQLMKELV
jgi:hypothetical protein